MTDYISATDLFNNFRLIKREGIPMDERRQLLQELSDKTGYPLGRILDKTKGMQTVADLRFLLSAMKNVPKAKDGKHALNIVLYQPKNKSV